MDTLVKFMNEQSKLIELSSALEKSNQRILLKNLNDNLASIVISNLFKEVNDNMMIVTSNLYQAQKFYDKIVQVLGSEHVHFFPMDEFISAEMLASSDDFRQERLNTIVNILKNKKGVIVTHTIGAIRKLPAKEVYLKSIKSLKVGDIYDFEEMIKTAITMGYQRVQVVENRGELAIRGGIIDIYPYTEDHPFRIEFFDDEIDSLRLFDEKTQRTIKMIEECTITPIYELIYDESVKDQAINRLEEHFKLKIKTRKSKVTDHLEEHFNQDILNIEHYNELSKLHKYIDFFYENTKTIYDFLNKGLMIYLDFNSIVNTFNNFRMEYNQFYTELLEEQKIAFVTEHYIPIDHLLDFSTNQCFIQEYTQFNKELKLNQLIDFNSRNIEQYYGKLDDLYHEMNRNKNSKTYCICFNNKTSLNHFSDLLDENQIAHVMVGKNDTIVTNHVNLIYSELTEGFEIVDLGLKVLTNFELYKKTTKVVKYRSKVKDATKIKDLDELQIGDYVVHFEHGIGQYLGIKTLETNGIHKDFLQIAYKGEDKLYVPVENINLVQKYVGNEGTKPKIHKIGGTEWHKTKQKAGKMIRDIAAKLIRLYAERENTVGYSFSSDTAMLHEFEESFPYVETVDQLQAIAEVKEDMEKSIPMDRLLCGDVGYGKTEVAMRAAFKAVMDNKQVAYLAPTTILTQQHYENFIERFSDYPINIALLNRFVTKKQQEDIIKKVKKGQIDIVIGTHRLLSKDVMFKDLGLLIVDEEQRFGVEHKERIKEMKVNIDILTLTATPIPRTLQMSLIGVRSLSLLETPPANRYPVQTYVLEENNTVIKEAIERELARNGQIFYLHNRVENIEQKANKIAELVKDAKVTFAHGQMSKEQLEKTMISFLNREFDVLVCTTIIETGIDIANANTLIISDADKLGLAQLYQLRGRVGRSDRIAYAYMMYPKRKVLSEIAHKRLQAIKEFTELGSGFKIAKQDLAIRGAGDLLGAQQYGFIDSIGFELYTKMLKEAVLENRDDLKLKDQQVETSKDIEIRILQDAYIPTQYISEESLKIEIYKKIKLISHYDDLIEIENELIDRFSDFPNEVQNLLNISFIKSVCLDIGINKIVETKTNVEFNFTKEASFDVDGEKIFMAANEISSNINFKFINKKLVIIVDKPRLKESYLSLMRRFFVKIIQSRIMSKNE